MTITEQISHLSQGEFWLFFSLAVLLSATGFFFAFRYLRRARIIEDTPTARVRSAQQGYLELSGEAVPMGGDASRAPLTGVECCWFHYKIEKKGGKNWSTLEKKTSDRLFLLRDETGDCIIDPDGAEVTPTDRNIWYGESRYPSSRPAPAPLLNDSSLTRWAKILNTDIGISTRYRYTEERIYPGDTIYTIGLFRSLDEIDHRQSRRERTFSLLRDWKQDRIALLFQFDQNRNGRIDQDEWEKARQSAMDQARRENLQEQKKQIPHTLGNTGSMHHPFLISSVPKFGLVKRFHLRAAGGLALFFIAGSLAALMFGSRLVG